jgi:hypothetical protein
MFVVFIFGGVLRGLTLMPSNRGPAAELPPVRLRGIYATALTWLLAERGFPIVEPDVGSAARVRAIAGPVGHRVVVADRSDRQGVVIRGEPADVAAVGEALAADVPGALDLTGLSSPSLVFPPHAKEHLDGRRRRLAPTVANHHLLLAHGIAGVAEAEQNPTAPSEGLLEAGERLWLDALRRGLRRGATVHLTHAKPWRRDLTAKCEFESLRDDLLTLRRRFGGGGSYDSLDLPKYDGDWGRVEVIAGGSALRRTYYRASGELVGELFNVQTPAEIGPTGVWYVDLEVDVVRHPDGTVRVVDLDDLARVVADGVLPAGIAARAERLARRLAAALERGGDWRRAARLRVP